MSLSPDLSGSDQDPFSDDSTANDSLISFLFRSELRHMPHSDYVCRFRDRSVDVTARQDSINWILKVHEHYKFKPQTAFLSINYFDRFLSSISLPRENRWAIPLLSVTCLFLAAKMEERPKVPLLIDLQLFDPKFLFEPLTIRRMELFLLSNLEWRLRAVTPFDFLHHFISSLPPPFGRRGPLSHRLLSISSDLILSTARVIDFLEFRPSALAAAAVICAASEKVDSRAVCDYFLAVDKEMVRSCHQLMEKYVFGMCPTKLRKERSGEAEPEPPSPVGVLDAAGCGSSDTLLDNPGSISLQVEPPTKRLRSSAPDVQK